MFLFDRVWDCTLDLITDSALPSEARGFEISETVEEVEYPVRGFVTEIKK